MSRHDVLIIGGGPAACAAALRCGQLGLSVCMIHKAPKGSTASESIPPGLQPLLMELGMDYLPETYSRGIYSGIWGNGGYQPLNPYGTETWEGHHIDKDKFTGLFREVVKTKGCLVINGQISSLVSANGRITGVEDAHGTLHKATFVIDCSGRQQLAARFLKLKKKYYSPPLVAWSGRSMAVHLQLHASFFAFADHWNWIAPETDGTCSWTRLASSGWTDFSAPPELENYPMDSPPSVWNMRWRLFRPIVSKGLLVCGDAAGIIDPAASQGILTAVMAGIAAANCIGNIFNDPSAENILLANYDQWYLGQYENRARQLRSYYQELMPAWFSANWLSKPTQNSSKQAKKNYVNYFLKKGVIVNTQADCVHIYPSGYNTPPSLPGKLHRHYKSADQVVHYAHVNEDKKDLGPNNTNV